MQRPMALPPTPYPEREPGALETLIETHLHHFYPDANDDRTVIPVVLAPDLIAWPTTGLRQHPALMHIQPHRSRPFSWSQGRLIRPIEPYRKLRHPNAPGTGTTSAYQDINAPGLQHRRQQWVQAIAAAERQARQDLRRKRPLQTLIAVHRKTVVNKLERYIRTTHVGTDPAAIRHRVEQAQAAIRAALPPAVQARFDAALHELRDLSTIDPELLNDLICTGPRGRRIHQWQTRLPTGFRAAIVGHSPNTVAWRALSLGDRIATGQPDRNILRDLARHSVARIARQHHRTHDNDAPPFANPKQTAEPLDAAAFVADTASASALRRIFAASAKDRKDHLVILRHANITFHHHTNQAHAFVVHRLLAHNPDEPVPLATLQHAIASLPPFHGRPHDRTVMRAIRTALLGPSWMPANQRINTAARTVASLRQEYQDLCRTVSVLIDDRHTDVLKDYWYHPQSLATSWKRWFALTCRWRDNAGTAVANAIDNATVSSSSGADHQLTWQSPDPPHNIGPVRITPLTSPADLRREAQSMQHCISTLIALFTAREQPLHAYHLEAEHERSTLTINEHPASWSINEHRGPRNHRAPEILRQAASALLRTIRLEPGRYHRANAAARRASLQTRITSSPHGDPTVIQAARRTAIHQAFPELRPFLPIPDEQPVPDG